MNKASIWFLCLAASLLGALVGLGLAGSADQDAPSPADAPSAADASSATDAASQAEPEAARSAEGALSYRLLDMRY